MGTKKKRIGEELTQEIADVLLYGHDHFQIFVSEAHKRYVWRTHREALLTMWFEDEENLGHRPWAWWAYDTSDTHDASDVPRRRRRVGGTGQAVREQPGCPAWAKGLSFGMPHVFCDYNESDPPRFESELEYLEPRGLLTPEEERLCSKSY
jgi:hypothetical protein